MSFVKRFSILYMSIFGGVHLLDVRQYFPQLRSGVVPLVKEWGGSPSEGVGRSP